MASSEGYLLDTCILVHLLRDQDTGRRIQARFNIGRVLSYCVISVVTVGEILSLARKRNWKENKLEMLESYLNELVQIDISKKAIIEAYAEIDAHCESCGHRMGQQNDIWIAATAKASGLRLLTTDADFDYLAQQGLIDRDLA